MPINALKPLTISRIVIISLAAVSLLLFILFITTSTPASSGSTPPIELGDIAGYDPSSGYLQDYSTGETVSGSDGSYTVTDDATLEMDSIPNDAAPPSGSDLGA